MKILLTSTMALAVLYINQPVKADPTDSPNIHMVRAMGGGAHNIGREEAGRAEEAGREEAAAREKEDLDRKENSTEAEAAKQRNNAEMSTAESDTQTHTRSLEKGTGTGKNLGNKNFQKYDNWTGIDGGVSTDGAVIEGNCYRDLEGNCVPDQNNN